MRWSKRSNSHLDWALDPREPMKGAADLLPQRYPRKKLAIFKRSDEEVLASNTSKFSSKMKRIFYRLFPHFSPTAVRCMSGEGYKAEEAWRRISEALNIPTVPARELPDLPIPISTTLRKTESANTSGKRRIAANLHSAI